MVASATDLFLKKSWLFWTSFALYLSYLVPMENLPGFRKTLAKYGVNHRIASPYHPQTSGQVEIGRAHV